MYRAVLSDQVWSHAGMEKTPRTRNWWEIPPWHFWMILFWQDRINNHVPQVSCWQLLRFACGQTYPQRAEWQASWVPWFEGRGSTMSQCDEFGFHVRQIKKNIWYISYYCRSISVNLSKLCDSLSYSMFVCKANSKQPPGCTISWNRFGCPSTAFLPQVICLWNSFISHSSLCL